MHSLCLALYWIGFSSSLSDVSRTGVLRCDIVRDLEVCERQTETRVATRDRPSVRSSEQEYADARAFPCQESLLEGSRSAAEGWNAVVMRWNLEWDGVAGQRVDTLPRD
jgi:hypothetical protein